MNGSPGCPSRQERGAARFSETCARPSGGNAGRGPRAGRGLGGAGEGGKRREFQESYRQREWQEPAVTLETCWPMAAAKAVYGGGASPWQQEKPLERLLNASPGPRALREAPSGWGGDEGCWRGPQAEG